MAYQHFTFARLHQEFGINQTRGAVTPASLDAVPPSEMLATQLARAYTMPLRSEKMRSEMLVAPVLSEVRERYKDKIELFSGEIIIGDKALGLSGEIDFLLVRKPAAVEPEAPIFVCVEAKRGELESGLAQCAAEMLGAYHFNQRQGKQPNTLHGCVTSGSDWQFMRLASSTLTIDNRLYSTADPGHLLAVLQWIVEQS